MTGAKNPDMILANLRRLDEGSDASDTPDDPGSGSLGGGWGGMSTAQRLEALRAAVCGILAGGTVTAECREDGTGMDGTVTFPGVPADTCDP
jgi:hypothetical protein